MEQLAQMRLRGLIEQTQHAHGDPHKIFCFRVQRLQPLTQFLQCF